MLKLWHDKHPFLESECLIHFEKKAHICALGCLHADNNDNWFSLFISLEDGSCGSIYLWAPLNPCQQVTYAENTSGEMANYYTLIKSVRQPRPEATVFLLKSLCQRQNNFYCNDALPWKNHTKQKASLWTLCSSLPLPPILKRTQAPLTPPGLE